ncbi:MAG: cytochrome c [Planctomycetes bacterium]|nr:cytochrome c [Planctomycetota bacterium]
MDRLKLANIAMLVAGIGLTVTGSIFWLMGRTHAPEPTPHSDALPEGESLIAAGEQLVREHNCNFCHRTERPSGHPAVRDNCQLCHQYHDRPENLGPPLAHVAERRPEEWIRRYLRFPYKLRPHSADRMPDLGLSDRSIEILTRYLVAVARPLSGTPVSREETPDPTRLEAGRALFATFGCDTCHGMGEPGFAPMRRPDGTLAQPAAVFAPDLGMAFNRLRPEWAAQAILEPEKWLPWAGMPKQNMTPDQARTLAWYVFNAGPRHSTKVDHHRVEAILRARCNGCHYGPDPKAGPSTNPEGGAGWLGTWGKPRKLDLMSIEGLMRGAVDDLGRPRPTVIPWAENTPLIMHLRGLKQPHMPFGGDPLPAEELAELEDWIAGGAPVPREQGGIKVAPPIEMGNGR